MVERPVRHARAGEPARELVQRAAVEVADRLLAGVHRLELPAVARGERSVARERRGLVLAALEHGAQLSAERDPEVERGPDALRGQRQAVAGAVAGEEHAVLGRGPQAVWDPVALVAVRLLR